MRRLIFLLPLFLFAQKSNVAILQFDAANISEAEVGILTDRLSTELVKLGSFTVVERSQMEEVLKEQGLQQSGCTTSECAVEVGFLLGVDKMITGSIGRIGSLFTLSARIIDVETGEILRQVSLDVSGTIEKVLTQTMAEIASQLSGTTPVPAGPKIAFGSVSFTSSEANVIIIINGEEQGTVPLVINNLPPGNYEFVARKTGYRDLAQEFSIKSNEQTTVDIVLEFAEGFLEVKAARQTQKFDLYIADGVYQGINSKKMGLPAGDYAYTIKEFGYADLNNTITVMDRETVTLTANTQPLMVPITFQIYPKSSVLMLNGQLVDTNNFEVPFGSSNDLSVKAPKYLGSKESFSVNNTEAIDLSIKLLPKSKNKAILNSLLFPGYGQYYYESKTKALLFSITAASLTALLTSTYTTYQDDNSLVSQYQLDYQNATTIGDIESTWQTYQNQANQVNDLQAQLLIYGGALGATWIINVVDALLFNGLEND